MVGGVSVTTKDIATTLQARIVTAKAATSARATWQAAVQADRDERAKTKTLVSVVKQTLLASFAGQVETLANFGLTPRKPRVVSPESRVAAAAKAKATRAARHTLGKKQKAGIKGTVAPTAPAIPTPATTPGPTPPAAPATTPIPAPTQTAPTTSPATPATPTRGA
jgi:sulfite reductase beta subunit-like hemoprotein